LFSIIGTKKIIMFIIRYQNIFYAAKDLEK